MKAFKELLAYLIVSQVNFRNLHWVTTGIDFFPVHEKMGEYYACLDGYIDEIAEISLMLGYGVVNIKDAMEILSESEKEFTVTDIEDKKAKDIFEESKKIWETISELIGHITEDDNLKLPSHIVSKLDEMQYNAFKEAKYKLTQLLK